MNRRIQFRFELLCALSVSIWIVAVPQEIASASNTNAAPAVDPLVRSAYSNTNNRPDPFLPARMKSKGVEAKAVFDDRELRLQGILWHPTNPVAIVNRQRLNLNEAVTLKLSTGESTVKAVKIERDRVVLKIDNRQVELQIER